jgi:hypothetical protein
MNRSYSSNHGSRHYTSQPHPSNVSNNSSTAAANLGRPSQDKYYRFEMWLRENGAHFERVSNVYRVPLVFTSKTFFLIRFVFYVVFSWN